MGISILFVFGGLIVFNYQSGQTSDTYGGSGGPLNPQPASNAIDFDEIVNVATLDDNWTITSSAWDIYSSAGFFIDDTVSVSGTITFGGITGSTQCLHVDTNGVLSGTGSDCGAGGAGTTTPHDLLNQDWHTDATNASASQGDLIYGVAADNWAALTVGASNSFLQSNGADVAWNDLIVDISDDTNLTAGDLITLTGDDLDVDADLHNYTWTNVVDADITNTLTASELICTDCINATEIEDIYFLTAGDIATHATISDDFETLNGIITSGSFGRTFTNYATASVNFGTPSAEITSGSFGTFWGAGLVDCDNATTSKLLYSDTGVFSCGTDQTGGGSGMVLHGLLSDEWHNDVSNASASEGDLILGVGTTWTPLAIGASNSFLITNGTTALWDDTSFVRYDGTTDLTGDWTISANSITLTAGTVTANTLSDGTTTLTNGTLGTVTMGGNIDFDLNDIVNLNQLTMGDADMLFVNGTASMSSTLYVGGASTFVGAITEGGIAVLNNDEMDGSAELLNIFDDETGTGVIVFGTSPQFTTSFTTAGVFAINPGGALTIGDGGDTLVLNSSDWDIDATGIMTGIGAITADGLFTGTGASLSGDLDIVGDLNVASASIGTVLMNGGFFGAGASLSGDLDITGDLNVASASLGTTKINGGISGVSASLSADLDVDGDFNTTSASFSGNIQTAGDLLIQGGNLNTGNTGFTIGDATTDTITFTADGSGNAEFTFPADVIGDADIDWGSGAGQVDLADITGGISNANVWDFGGATSFEIPNAAAPTINALGQVALDSTEDQLLVYGTDGITVFMATRSYAFGVASGSAGLLVDGPLLPFDFTISSASCLSGNVAGEIYIIDVYECDASDGTCGEHINAASVSCNGNDTSFLPNDKLGDAGDFYRFKIQSTNDSCENTDQVVLTLWGGATRK